jgi:hypothetical protein
MSDQMNIDARGGNNQIGGSGSSFTQGVSPSAGPAVRSGAPLGDEAREDLPAYGLYGFADIVGYSKMSTRLQKSSQDYLVELLDDSLAEAGVQARNVAAQDQGDARFLTFPGGTDIAKVLAVLPRYLNDELLSRNLDMAEHARMQVRLSFTIGATVRGGTGFAGSAPIAVVRLSNFPLFRRIMTEAQAQCGVIIDDHLYRQYVVQRMRPDIRSDDYVPVRVADAQKDFAENAWLRLLGYSGQQVALLLS